MSARYRYGDQRPDGLYFYQRRSGQLTEIWLTEAAFLKACKGKMPEREGRLRADGRLSYHGEWLTEPELRARQREAKLLSARSKRHARGDLGTMFLKRPNRYGETAIPYLFWGYRKQVVNPTYGPEEQLWVRADRFKQKLYWQDECQIRALELAIARRKARAVERRTAAAADKKRRMSGVFVKTIRGVRVALDADLLAAAMRGEPAPASLTNKRKRQAYLWLLAKWKRENGANTPPFLAPATTYRQAKRADAAFFRLSERRRKAKETPQKGTLERELIESKRLYLSISQVPGTKITTADQ